MPAGSVRAAVSAIHEFVGLVPTQMFNPYGTGLGRSGVQEQEGSASWGVQDTNPVASLTPLANTHNGLHVVLYEMRYG